MKLIHGIDGTNDGDVASSNPFPVTVNRVTSLVDGTVSVENITRVRNVVDGTLSLITRVDRVLNLIDGTLSVVGAVTNITNSINVHLLSTNGTIGVNIGTLTNTASISAKDGTFAIYFSPANPKVHLGTDIINTSHTAVIGAAGGTVSGSVTSVGGSGINTIISPEASRNIKVYAFSLTTTAQVGITPRFTTGGSAGATEKWRVALQAPSQGIAGANLAVTPPGYLFETGSGNTLAIYLDSASLVHYSVSYFKESA